MRCLLLANCLTLSRSPFPLIFFLLPAPCHSTETTLTGVIDDLLAADGQFQPFVFWISTHLSLRVSHFSLLIVHTLVSVTLYYSDFPPVSLSLSVFFWNMCVHSSAWSHLLFSGYTVSWTISPLLLASPMCSLKTAHVYFEVESLTWPFFLSFSHQEEPIHQHVWEEELP